MNTLLTRAAIAALGLVFVAGANVATAAPKQSANPYDCFTDDGYGRKRSCSQGYKARRAGEIRDNCLTGDAFGRRRPCAAANFKRQRKP
jgi:hypothetical protein